MGSKAELRHNPYHDPATGRFCSGGGGGFYKPGGSLNGKDKFRLYANGGGLTNPQNGGKIKATLKERQAIEKVLIGTNTFNGVTISGVSVHAADRMVQRNISATEVKNALADSKISYPGNEPDSYCVQQNQLRIVYSGSGNLISVVKL